MNYIKAWILLWRLTLKWPFKLCIGDHVRYKGKRYTLTNKKYSNSWSMTDSFDENGCYGPGYIESVHVNDFKKEKSLRNLVHDIRSGYRFYRGYWFDIWVIQIREKRPLSIF